MNNLMGNLNIQNLKNRDFSSPIRDKAFENQSVIKMHKSGGPIKVIRKEAFDM